MNSCLRNVYITFLVGLLIMAGFLVLYRRLAVPVSNVWLYFGVFIASILLILMLGRMAMGVWKVLVGVAFLAALAYIFYPLVASLRGDEIWKFVLITALFFIVLTIIAFVLPTATFASWGNILFILLFLLIIFGLLGGFLFRNSPQFRLVFYLLVLLVFGGLILYDTYRIANFCDQSDAINSALPLVLNAANVFGATSGIGTL